MRSPMVQDCDPVNEHKYSDLQVLKSAAGYYIGTIFTNGEDDEFPGLEEPGSRDSYDYYPTEEAAKHALNTRSWIQRDHP